MLGWKRHKLESRWQGEISITSGMQKTLSECQKVKRNYRTFDEVERGDLKSGLESQH